MNLKHLTDSVLLSDTKRLASKEREISLQVLHHLREIEKRRLFSDLKYSSLFEYAVKELKYSEPSAARRIHAARLLQEMPEIEKRVESGSLNLTNLALAANHFKSENIKDPKEKIKIVSKLENSTKKECEKTLLSLKVDGPLPREIIKQVSNDFHSVKFNWSEETMRLFNELKGLYAHQRLNHDETLKRVFRIAIYDHMKRKFKTNAKFTTLAESPCETRYIPAIIKKKVFKRDQGQCTNCKTKYKLEYDHITPHAMGGKSTLKNLRLLCFSCNQRRLI